MPDLKISQLTEIITPIYSMDFAMNNGGVNYKMSHFNLHKKNYYQITDSNYTLTAIYNLVEVTKTTSSGGSTLNLPASPGSSFLMAPIFIKLVQNSTTPTSDYLTVSGNGNTIEGQSTIRLISDADSLYIYWNGTEWKQLSSHNIQVTSAGVLSVARELNAPSFNTTSKREFKKEISDVKKSVVDLIKSVKVVNFYFKSDDKNESLKIGFIADDTDKLLSGKDHDHMDLANCIGVLFKGMQELIERVEKLENGQ